MSLGYECDCHSSGAGAIMLDQMPGRRRIGLNLPWVMAVDMNLAARSFGKNTKTSCRKDKLGLDGLPLYFFALLRPLSGSINFGQ